MLKAFSFLRYLYICPDVLLRKKRLDKQAMINFKIMTSQTGQQIIASPHNYIMIAL